MVERYIDKILLVKRGGLPSYRKPGTNFKMATKDGYLWVALLIPYQ